MARNAKVRLELGIGEAYHIVQALEAYIKSGVYGSNLVSWREIRDKVKSGLHRAALEEKHGSKGYRGNPGAGVHAKRARAAIDVAGKYLADATDALNKGKMERAAVQAMNAHKRAFQSLREMIDAKIRPTDAGYVKVKQIGRAAEDVVSMVGRIAQYGRKSKKKPPTKKPARKVSGSGKKTTQSKSGEGEKLKRKIARM